MSHKNNPSISLDSLLWLDDAPLFIDGLLINRFHDAVVQPTHSEVKKVVEVTEESAKKLQAKLGLEGEISPGGVTTFLKAFLDAKLTASGEIEGGGEWAESETQSVELITINTPSSQLKQIITHYLANHEDRLFLVPNVQEEKWRSNKEILKVPRALAFIDLPSQEEAQAKQLPETRLIPTAAEFEDGGVIPLFPLLVKQNGEKPPIYPEKAESPQQLKQLRQNYWRWFDENFSATQTMIVVEEAAAEHGRIQWIDYRVPLTNDGDTLHLHVSPRGEYDTGNFAYNFIKRGYKHGMRIVGTLKSEPDMNVMAIFEK